MGPFACCRSIRADQEEAERLKEEIEKTRQQVGCPDHAHAQPAGKLRSGSHSGYTPGEAAGGGSQRAANTRATEVRSCPARPARCARCARCAAGAAAERAGGLPEQP